MRKLIALDRKFDRIIRKIFRPMISILVTFSILFSSIPLGYIVKANAASINGTGTSSDPYVITTADQLASISTTGLGKCYKLGNNIDLSSYANWTPIGSDSKPFTGTLDGGGHTISNLTIGAESSPSTSSYLGLFGYTNGATIKNVGLNNVSIYSSGKYIGALAGYCNGAEIITNASAAGNVSGSSEIGGLIGYINNSNAKVLNSYAADKVTGSSDDVGGLIGYFQGTIKNCYAKGGVSGHAEIGGLIGYNYSNGTITNSYATGSTIGAYYVGGLVGYNRDNNSKIINSYATGNVSGNQTVGSFLGYNYNSDTVTDVYWKTATQMPGCGSGTISSGTGMGSAKMQTQTFADTLNKNIDSLNLSDCACWKYSPETNNGFPVLQGIGNGVGSSDTIAPKITTSVSQNYTSGEETIHATVLDENSGISVKKYAAGVQEASYFTTNGIEFHSSIIDDLALGTYTVYAKDNAGCSGIVNL